LKISMKSSSNGSTPAACHSLIRSVPGSPVRWTMLAAPAAPPLPKVGRVRVHAPSPGERPME
jgi:hypothetical protein